MGKEDIFDELFRNTHQMSQREVCPFKAVLGNSVVSWEEPWLKGLKIQYCLLVVCKVVLLGHYDPFIFKVNVIAAL